MKLNYPYKVWLLTVSFSPFILLGGWGLYNSANFGDFASAVPLLAMMLIFGVGLSLPALWLCQLLFKDLLKHDIRVPIKKFILAGTGIILIWVTFFLLDRSFFKDGDFYSFSWPASYSMVLLVSALLSKFQRSSPTISK